ncbi:hypothetical protein [Arcicella aurantiaca]|nr:hypothetical protein [Arcicella aurantiaca]
MKFLILILAFTNSLVAQRNNTTLKETVNWMSSKVEGEIEYFGDTEIYHYVNLSWDDKRNLLRFTTYSKSKNPSQGLQGGGYCVEFDPKNIDPKSFSIKDEETYIKVFFYCNSGSGCVTQYDLINYNKDWKDKGVSGWRGDHIDIYKGTLKKNENLPERFIQAFKHLIQLRGGKGEVF